MLLPQGLSKDNVRAGLKATETARGRLRECPLKLFIKAAASQRLTSPNELRGFAFSAICSRLFEI